MKAAEAQGIHQRLHAARGTSENISMELWIEKQRMGRCSSSSGDDDTSLDLCRDRTEHIVHVNRHRPTYLFRTG